MQCSICNNELFGYKDENMATIYPGLVCRKCDERALNTEGKKPKMNVDYDDGENPVFIDGIKCWRRYRFGGFVTIRDYNDSQNISDFYSKQFKRNI